MSDYGKLIYGFIFSVTGIAFGWALNQAGQWFRVRQEDKKNLKLVLFNLLETYFLFLRSDVDRIAKEITKKIFIQVPKQQQTKEGEEMIATIFSTLAKNTLKPQLLNELKAIEINYQASIMTLASIDPLAAYYLSGKTNILDRFELLENWFTEHTRNYSNEASTIQSGANQIIDIIKTDLLDETLKDLEKDILNIAWKINLIVWVKSKKVLEKLKKKDAEGNGKTIDEMMQKFQPYLTSLD